MTKQTESLNELRRMTVAELDDHLGKQRRRLFEVRFQQATGQVENHRQVREIRHEIARTMTVKIEIERGLRPELLLAEPPVARPAKAAAKPKPEAPRAKARARGSRFRQSFPQQFPLSRPLSQRRRSPSPSTPRRMSMSDATQAAVTRSRRKARDGVVVSDKMEKTVIVLVQISKPHPLYKKVVRHSRRFKVHDDERCGIGDRVRIIETRPNSTETRWRVAEVLEKAR